MKSLFLILIIIFLFGQSGQAQELPSFQPVFNLTANPSIPKPNDLVTVRATVFSLDPRGANFSWILNGLPDRQSSGLNKNTYQFKTGPRGTIYNLALTVTFKDGITLSDSISFTVSGADFTWQAKTYAPVDFPGKLLAAPNSEITVSVNPEFFSPGSRSLLNPKNLAYSWIRNGENQTASSGVGKATFTFITRKFSGEKEEISVEILTSQNRVLNAGILIPIADPEIVFNVKNKSNNIYYNQTPRLYLNTADKIEIKALSYFLATPSNQIRWQWFENDEEINNPRNDSRLDLKFKNDIILPFSTLIKAVIPLSIGQKIENFIQINVVQ